MGILDKFKKKKKAEPQGQEGEQPVAKVDVFPSQSDLEVQVRQREKGQRIDTEREPIQSGVVRQGSSASDLESAAKIRELLFNPDENNLEILAVTKKQHWIALAAEATFCDIREAGENRKSGNYFSVARRFITHLDRRSISVQGNSSEARNAMLQIHQDMSQSDHENGKTMGMG